MIRHMFQLLRMEASLIRSVGILAYLLITVVLAEVADTVDYQLDSDRSSDSLQFQVLFSLKFHPKLC